MLHTNLAILACLELTALNRSWHEQLFLLLSRQSFRLRHVEIDPKGADEGEEAIHEEDANGLHRTLQKHWCHEVLKQDNNILRDHDHTKGHICAHFRGVKRRERPNRHLEQEGDDADEGDQADGRVDVRDNGDANKGKRDAELTDQEDCASADDLNQFDGENRAEKVEAVDHEDALASVDLATAIAKVVYEQDGRVRDDSVVPCQALEGHNQDGNPTGACVTIITAQSLCDRHLTFSFLFTACVLATPKGFLLSQVDVVDLLLVTFGVVHLFDDGFGLLLLSLLDIEPRWIVFDHDAEENDGNDE